MRLLFIGDVVGRTGRKAVERHVPELRRRLDLDFVVVNGENAAGGFGLTESIARDFFASGVDVISGGNHSWDQKNTDEFMARESRVLRPANYPPGTSGRGAGLFDAAGGQRILVINIMGRVFMDPLDDPFAAVAHELGACPLGEGCDTILVDMHAEATSEKMAMGHFCDGRVSVVVGSHTHVPTADVMILSGGTAYQTDAGMTGDYDSVVGMEKDEPVNRFTTKISRGRFTVSQGEATLCGLFVETDDRTGLAVRAEPLRVGGCLTEALPSV